MFKDFLAIINERLDGAGIPHDVYAEWLGTSQAAVKHVLRGRRGISFERAQYFGAVLGLNLRIVAEDLNSE